MKRFLCMATVMAATWAAPLAADSTRAACDIFPAGQDRHEKMIPCTFSQRQGYVTIARADGVTHELSPVGDGPGNFTDQAGRKVYRQGGLGDQGQIFRFPDISIYVYWDETILDPKPAGKDNPTAPFTTADFDATALFRCKAPGETAFGSCPGGISRMEDKQASITVRSPRGEQFTINFMTGYVNATNREVKARLEGDTWILNFANGEVWEVPLAAIEGG